MVNSEKELAMKELNFCKDCKHAQAAGSYSDSYFSISEPWTCLHPLMREPVEAKPGWTCKVARDQYSNSLCGHFGALWEPGVPAPSQFTVRMEKIDAARQKAPTDTEVGVVTPIKTVGLLGRLFGQKADA